jgi:hypothetical protein
MVIKNIKIRKNQSYLNYLFRLQKKGFLVSEQIALIRSNSINSQDVPKQFIPSNTWN